MNPWLTLALQLEPAIPVLVADLKKLFTKHPALADPTAQAAFITSLANAASSVDDATLAAIVADQAAHPVAPVIPITPVP